MKNQQWLSDQIFLFYEEIRFFETVFYSASPDRGYLGGKKKSYREYSNSWLEKKSFEEIEKAVADYSNRHWLLRLWYWFINHEDYKKYQWMVYKRKEAQLHDYEDAIWNSQIENLNQPSRLIISTLLSKEISYLPKACCGLLSKLARRVTMLRALFEKLTSLAPSDAKSTSSTEKSGLEKVKEDKHKIAKLCGFLKQPYGVPGISLIRLESLLNELQKIYAYGRITIQQDAQLKKTHKNMLLCTQKYKHEIEKIKQKYRSEFFWNILEQEHNPSEQKALEASYREGVAEADQSWVAVVENSWDRHILYRVQLSAALLGKDVYALSGVSLCTINALPTEAELVDKYNELQDCLMTLNPHDLEEEDENCYQIAKQTMETLDAAITAFRRCRFFPPHLIPQQPSTWIDKEKMEAHYIIGIQQHRHLCWLRKKAADVLIEKLEATVEERALSRIPDFGRVNHAKAFYFACGFFDVAPSEEIFRAIPRMVRHYIHKQRIHPDQIVRGYSDEKGEAHLLPTHLIEYANVEERYTNLFQYIQNWFSGLNQIDYSTLLEEFRNISINSCNEYRAKGKSAREKIDDSIVKIHKIEWLIVEGDKKDKIIEEQDKKIEEQDKKIEEQDKKIEEQDKKIKELDKEIEELDKEKVRRIIEKKAIQQHVKRELESLFKQLRDSIADSERQQALEASKRQLPRSLSFSLFKPADDEKMVENIPAVNARRNSWPRSR